MNQLTTMISHGNQAVEPVFRRMGRSMIGQHVALGLTSLLVVVTDIDDLLSDVPPYVMIVKARDLPSFDFRTRHQHYLDAIDGVDAVRDDALLLRDADTIVLKMPPPPPANRIGLVRWKRAYNCGAMYVGADAFEIYRRAVDTISTQYDEIDLTNFFRNEPESLAVLPPAFNYDCRWGVDMSAYLLHCCRRQRRTPEVDSVLMRFGMEGAAGRGRRFFGKYIHKPPD